MLSPLLACLSPAAEDIADLTVLSQAPSVQQQQPYTDPAIISASVRKDKELLLQNS